MPRIGTSPKPRQVALSLMVPDSRFRLPPYPSGYRIDQEPPTGTFVELVGYDAKVQLDGERTSTIWSGQAIVIPDAGARVPPGPVRPPVTRMTREEKVKIERINANPRPATAAYLPIVGDVD